MKHLRILALLSSLFLLVTASGIAHADVLRSDGDSLEAGLQSGNPATVALAPGATHTFRIAAHIVSNGNTHVSFPVTVDVAKTETFLGTPSPTSGDVTAYGSAGQLAAEVVATAPAASTLTCGITNTFSGRVTFTARTDLTELGTQGTNAELILKITVNGPACPSSDTAAPVISGMPTGPTVEATGPSGAIVTWTPPSATDAVDGPVPVVCTPASGGTFAIGATIVTCAATDAANNSSSSQFVVTVRDTTAPAVSCGSADGVWHADDVSIACTASDSGAGLALAGDASFNLSTNVAEGSQTATASTGTREVCDRATPANCATAGPIGGNQVDKKDPAVTVALTSAPNLAGWYKTGPTYSVTGTDVGGSGGVTCDAGGTYDGDDGTDLTIGPKSCTDVAGNSGSDSSDEFKLDSTDPEVTVALTSAPNLAGWYKTGPTYSVTGTDVGGSGGVTCDAGGTYDGDDGTDLTIGPKSCTDVAGNSGSDSSDEFKLDSIAPSVTLIGGPANGAEYFFGDTIPTATCTASDTGSDLAAPCTVSGNSTAVGTHSLSASATDNAGNTGSTGSSPRTYTINTWRVNGFYRPVDIDGFLNTVKAGSTVPLKFNLYATAEITDTAAVESLKARSVSCQTLSDLTPDAIETVATGGTSLRYDTSGAQFVYNWQTPRSSGTCWKVTMTADDGSTLTANFKLK